MKLKSLILLAALGLLCTPAWADEVVIDFEAVVIDDNGRIYTDEYIQDGFILTVEPGIQPDTTYVDSAIMGATRGLNERGSSNFYWRSLDPPINLILRQLNGEPFSFKSFWVGQIGHTDTAPSDIRPISITGFLSGGGTVTQDIDPNGGAWAQHLINSNFTDLLKVEFNLHPLPAGMPTLRSPSMDDLELCSVPEPSTLLLLSGGLGLVGFLRRRLG